MEIEQLKYPIGQFTEPEVITPGIREKWIEDISSLPGRLETALAGWTDDQLDTPYRPGGWTVRQLVHHLADSHQHAHCRIRLALTEEQPVIKPYDQDAWIQLADVQSLPVIDSLNILRGVHARWAFLLKKLDVQALQRTFIHPEHGKSFTVENTIGTYAWHGNHHLAHITGLKERMGW